LINHNKLKGELPSAIDYYKNSYTHDLELALDPSPHYRDRISIVSLLPEQAKVFGLMRSPYLFLFCFFFNSLLDQAIHSGLRAEHPYFDRIARYPKIVGILSTYWHNIHPVVLLMAATFQISIRDEKRVTEDFQQLSDFFIEDYCDFFLNQYPKLTGRLESNADRLKACISVLSKISSALAILFCPNTIIPYSRKEANQELVAKWVAHFRNNVNKKLKALEHQS
jgi:hypothetical protein